MRHPFHTVITMSATIRNYAVEPGLPKKTESICPECGKILEASIFEENGKVLMQKECPQHGLFRDVYWSDVGLYLKAEKYAHDGIGLTNPADSKLKEGENANFIIDGKRIDMLSSTGLANVDLTNRCNMNCPICFAVANQAGYVYEPDFATIVKMLETLRTEAPIRCTAVQFSGGEPTIYPMFLEAIAKAKELNFAQVQVATNGIKFAKDYEFLKKASQAGMNTIYLSFDGVSDDVYLQARDRRMFQIKLDVIANCKRLREDIGKSPSIVLVPTVVKGMNDHQIGAIVDFALEHADVVRGINFQPVAFTGRIEREELEAGRFTLPDLAREMGEQTGYTDMDDWYPVPVVAPISNFASIILDENKVTFTAHPHCGIATYLFVGDDGKVTPFPRFVDLDRFSTGMAELAEKAEKARFKKFTAIKIIKLMNSCIIDEKLPEGLDKKKFIMIMKDIMSNKSKKTLAKFSWKMMLISGMHFQDAHNYDVERVKRCCIHYVTPDCEVIPFCAYNGGPEYRKAVESRHSVPLDEWKAANKKEALELEQALIVPEDQKA
jgi:uncharacterized radical SAM superfamily Fe-S cluster-containing enzyme